MFLSLFRGDLIFCHENKTQSFLYNANGQRLKKKNGDEIPSIQFYCEKSTIRSNEVKKAFEGVKPICDVLSMTRHSRSLGKVCSLIDIL